MITALTGENDFEIKRAVDKIISSFNGAVERIDGSQLELRQLPDLLMGGTLFSDKRLVIIKDLSSNKTIWPELGRWIEQLSDDVELVLIEPKLDKRTKTYKDLQKMATVRDYKPWGERDMATASRWMVDEAKQRGLVLAPKFASLIVSRVGVDQWRLVQAIEKLRVLDEVNEAVIENVIDAKPSENVFELFETALRGNIPTLQRLCTTLELTEDPYRVFGLLSGQGFQLTALAVSDKPSGEVAKDIGAHPFVVSKLSSHASRLGSAKCKKVIHLLVEADEAMKTSAAAPWLLIERALIKIARI